MVAYLLILSLVLLWITLEKHAVNRKSFWTPLFLLSIFPGMRSYSVGTDSGAYSKYFRQELPLYNYSFSESSEYGFQLLQYIILYFTYNYFWLFFSTALIAVFLNLKVLTKLSVNYVFSVLFYITLGSYTFIFNGIRQGLSMAIFVVAIPYFLQKKLLPYISIVLLASLFHRSALVMIPIYFVAHLNIKDIYKIVLSFFSSLIASSVVIAYLAANNPRYKIYTNEVDNAGGYLTLGFYACLSILLYIIKYLTKINDLNFNRLLLFYTVGIASVIPLAFLGTDPSGPQRIIYYYTWALALLLPHALCKLNNLFFYSTAIVFSVIFFVLTVNRFGNLTPYVINPLFKIF